MASLKLTRKRKEKVAKQKGKAPKFDSLKKQQEDEDNANEFLEIAEKESGSERDDDEPASEEETADAKRLRVAKAFLQKAKIDVEDELVEHEDLTDFDGVRDSLVADQLHLRHQEESGRTLRYLSKKFIKQEEPVAPGISVGRRHRYSVTAVALTMDDSEAFSASKDGAIVQWDVETNSSFQLKWPSSDPSTSGRIGNSTQSNLKASRSSRHILALDVSFDGRYLAAGGLDQKIHLWDLRTRQYVQAFKGHRGAVSGLSFREGTHQLFSASYDRSIKIWSVDDLAYMDSLYGHQSEIVSVDCLRQERVLSAGRDRTCRIWKVPEETQLVLRGHSASIDCCAMITGNDFISGSEDGSVALWSSVRKKPVHVVRGAHGGRLPVVEVPEADSEEDDSAPKEAPASGEVEPSGSAVRGVPGGAAEAWVGAVVVCRNSDLAASGAGDGCVRLWNCDIANRKLRPLHRLPARGFVNSLAFATSGRFVLVGTGQEPRLGRWGQIKAARNGVEMHRVPLSD